MTSKVVYEGDLRTTCVHLQSTTRIETDAPVDNQGRGERFSPTDLVATSLATCLLTTVAIIGKGHGINIDGAECEVTKIMASNPRRIAEVVINISFPKSGPYEEKEKTMIMRIAETCPVAISLHPDLKQTLTFKWPNE